MRLLKIAFFTLLTGFVLIYLSVMIMSSGFGSIVSFVTSLFFALLLFFGVSLSFFIISASESIKGGNLKKETVYWFILSVCSFIFFYWNFFSNMF